MSISKITNYIINLFQMDKLVNTIALNDREIIDTKKESIYPLVTIIFKGTSNSDEYLNYDYTIYVLQQRDSNRKIKPSKLMEETNYLDNLNECEDICNNFINFVRRFELDLPINIENEINLDPIFEYGGANLDGFAFDLRVQMPNTGYCGQN
jgi:hypothetical protein